MDEKIEPEQSDGNKEYKLKLVDNRSFKIDQWVSQMRYRITEGNGECIYYLGVTDDGEQIGMDNSEYKQTMDILNQIVQKEDYCMTLLTKKEISDNKSVYEFLIRQNNHSYVELKVAIAGTVDSGKSSTLGTLMTGKLDDGRGSSRTNVFNFSHEMKSGRTSSVAQHILGFDEKGGIIRHVSEFGKRTWPEIIQESSKVVTFFDLCGHEKYLKTTITGLTSQFPDLSVITVGANMGVSKITKEHVFLCLSLRIPFVILITKVDICKDRQNVLKNTQEKVSNLIKKTPVRRIPFYVKTNDDVIAAVKNFSNNVVPVIHTSNVTGEGLDLLSQFLNLAPGKTRSDSKLVELHVESIWSVPGVGTVIGGQLVSGIIQVGDKLCIGPFGKEYKQIRIRSIHCKRVPVQTVQYGRYVTLAISGVERRLLRRGHVVLCSKAKKVSVSTFTAAISVLKSHSTTIKVGYEPVLHVCSIRQSCKITNITEKKSYRTSSSADDDGILRTGDQAKVHFTFSIRPEYVKPGMRFLLAEGKVKIIGIIKEVTNLI